MCYGSVSAVGTGGSRPHGSGTPYMPLSMMQNAMHIIRSSWPSTDIILETVYVCVYMVGRLAGWGAGCGALGIRDVHDTVSTD
jgi:hypothetical protein